MSVLLGNGDGTFGAQTTFAVGYLPISVTTADVNDDGHADLITANTTSHTVSVLLGTGTGTFGAQTTFAVGSLPASVTTADVNDDGHADLIATNQDIDSVSVLLGMVTIAVTSVTATSPEPPGAPLKIGDTLPFLLATDVSIDSVTAGPGGAMPTLSLSNGATATFTGFDAAGLHFSYIV